MKEKDWVLKFLISLLAVLPLVILGTRVFVNSWTQAALVGSMIYLPIILGLLLIAHKSQLALHEEKIKQYGEILVTGDTLTFRGPTKPAVSVAATDMLELWYDFNAFGWDSANSFRLVYTIAGQKEKMEISQTSDHLEESLRSWCVAHLPNFDVAVFDSVRGLPGGNEDDILLWSCDTNVPALQVGGSALQSTTSILFYAVDKPYGCFSNFAPYPIVVDELVWPTSEHYFQASKMVDARDREEIRNASTPFLAAQLGRERTRQIRANWEAVKESEMIRALRNKFEQHYELKDILISTAGARLVEHTSNDSYWGDGGDGSGRNRLGFALEHIRAEFGAHQSMFYAPPWVMYPDVDVSDLFWKMGRGEDYLTQSATWRNALSPAARKEYEAYFPMSREWSRTW